ncbi:MAG: hypothetical protein HDR82_09470 [Bacteroides sp.]|nr:hypothetical protein [Bacteroides sp.]
MSANLAISSDMSKGRLKVNCTREQLMTYFKSVCKLVDETHDEFPVNLDDVWPLMYGRKQEAVRALVSNENFIEEIDYRTVRNDAQGGQFASTDYYLTTSCFEFFIARKKREVFEVYRQFFHKVRRGEMSLSQPPSNPQLAYVQTQLYLADALADRLRLNDASRLGMYQSIAAPYNLALPQYVESKGVTKSAKDLLKEIGSPISAVKFNMLLVEQGYLEIMTRPTSGGKIRSFKNITDKGLPYGKNLENPKNQKETQPHWYVDKFRELYNLVVA